MRLYNTLSRTIEDFKPIDRNLVKMYTCGPTVYNYAHIGNLRTYIHEDILEKTLRYIGYNVKRVMNITDVGHLESDADEGEDKMLKGARRENKTVWEIAQHYTDAFFDDIAKLNIEKPDVVARATDYINDYMPMVMYILILQRLRTIQSYQVWTWTSSKLHQGKMCLWICIKKIHRILYFGLQSPNLKIRQ